MGFLPGWNPLNRIRLDIDNSVIDSDIDNYVIKVHLSTSSGLNSFDYLKVFQLLGSNSLKIAFTDSDGVTELFVEIEKWDSSGKDATLHVGSFTALSALIKSLFFYFDPDHADNTAHVGVVGSTSGKSVYPSMYSNWYTLAQDPTTGGSPILDSTSSVAHLQNVGVAANDIIDGTVGKGVDLNNVANVNGFLSPTTSDHLYTTNFSQECFIKTPSSLLANDTIFVKANFPSGLPADGSLFLMQLASAKIGVGHQGASIVTTSDHLSPSTEHHIFIERDISAKTFGFWLDGVLLETKGYTTQPADGSNGKLAVGYVWGSTPVGGSNSRVDQIGLYNGSLMGSAFIKANNLNFRDQLISHFFDSQTLSCILPSVTVAVPKQIKDTIITIDFDTTLSTQKYGFNAFFEDVNPCLGSITASTTKINQEQGFVSGGGFTITLIGKSNFAPFIGTEYPKNRRVTKFVGNKGDNFADYEEVLTGLIWKISRRGDTLTIICFDDLAVRSTKNIPVKTPPSILADGGESSDFQSLIYANENIIDVILDMIIGGVTANNPITATQNDSMEISANRVERDQFEAERDLWFLWQMHRVIIEPTSAKELLNEIMKEINAFTTNNNTKITFSSFFPTVPSATISKEYTKDLEILDIPEENLGYEDYFNDITFKYDFDEDGNFESSYRKENTSSSGSAKWNESKSRVFESKSFKSRSHEQPNQNNASFTGVLIYYLSKANVVGEGVLTWNSTNETLTWKDEGGTVGDAETVDKNGTYQIFSSNKNKYVRVKVDFDNLPGSGQVANITIISLPAAAVIGAIANRLVNRYNNPVANISFNVARKDVESQVKNGTITAFSDAGGGLVTITSANTLSGGDTISIKGTTNYNGTFIVISPTTTNYKIAVTWVSDDGTGTWSAKLRPGNFIGLTTDDVGGFGKESFSNEEMMVTSLRELKGGDEFRVSCVQTLLSNNYGFVGPATITDDWDSQTSAEQRYMSVADSSGFLGAANDPAFLVI